MSEISAATKRENQIDADTAVMTAENFAQNLAGRISQEISGALKVEEIMEVLLPLVTIQFSENPKLEDLKQTLQIADKKLLLTHFPQLVVYKNFRTVVEDRITILTEIAGRTDSARDAIDKNNLS